MNGACKVQSRSLLLARSRFSVPSCRFSLFFCVALILLGLLAPIVQANHLCTNPQCSCHGIGCIGCQWESCTCLGVGKSCSCPQYCSNEGPVPCSGARNCSSASTYCGQTCPGHGTCKWCPQGGSARFCAGQTHSSCPCNGYMCYGAGQCTICLYSTYEPCGGPNPCNCNGNGCKSTVCNGICPFHGTGAHCGNPQNDTYNCHGTGCQAPGCSCGNICSHVSVANYCNGPVTCANGGCKGTNCSCGAMCPRTAIPCTGAGPCNCGCTLAACVNQNYCEGGGGPNCPNWTHNGNGPCPCNLQAGCKDLGDHACNEGGTSCNFGLWFCHGRNSGLFPPPNTCKAFPFCAGTKVYCSLSDCFCISACTCGP